MKYTESFHSLKSVFNPTFPEIQGISPTCVIQQFRFASNPALISEPVAGLQPLTQRHPDSDDSIIRENCEFTYPVFVPEGKTSNDRALILLHGLNERSWTKYLPWAQRLAEDLQRPVILFPISFHMNRSPAEWSNPRFMSTLLDNTRMRSRRNRSATFVNLALSMRLSTQPLRFYTSGSQSVRDLETLINSIQTGTHPLFNKGSGVDFFAYSIGAFLAQIMMLTYGNTLLSDSRLFMFCGGAPFNRMNGVSKLIMDEEAFTHLRFYFLRQFERELRSKGTLTGLLDSQPSSMAFRAMLDAGQFSNWRIHQFGQMEKRIAAISLKNDTVIPCTGIAEILAPTQLRVMDYAACYTHENPFPITGNYEAVDYSFEQVFSQAAAFLR